MLKLATSSLIAFGPLSLAAQTIVDIGLFPSQINDSTLEVRICPNADFGGVLSALGFTIRWPETSNATLGTRTNSCPSGIPVSQQAIVTNNGYHHRTYLATGTSLLEDEGCPLIGCTHNLVMRVPVVANMDLSEFELEPGNYYVSMNGNDVTGTIYTEPCMSTGQLAGHSVSEDNWSVFPNPATDVVILKTGSSRPPPYTAVAIGMDGRRIPLHALGGGRWDVSALDAGVYLLQAEGVALRFAKQ